ncbi:MAG TPA: YceI family protein [Bacteroidales bacterium]|nr:YceI family protein [Bacteroidales bacterium]
MITETLTKTKWVADKAHTEISFSVKYLMITWVRGVFRDVDITAYTDGDDFLTSSIEVRINAGSIYTGDEKRDSHLKSPDFLDVENYRQIVFISSTIQKTRDENRFVLNGILSVRYVDAPVKLNVDYDGTVRDPWGVEKAGFRITGEIRRSAWGLTWNTVLESGGVLVGDEVKIDCGLQLVKPDSNIE